MMSKCKGKGGKVEESETVEKFHIQRIRRYSCSACGLADCECYTENEITPTRCCMQFIPAWREGP